MPRAILANLSQSLLDDIEEKESVPKELRFFGGKYGKRINLCYNDDHPDAWTLLLYWAYFHCLPDSNWNFTHDDLIDGWLLGQAHSIPTFHDVVMVQLLQLRNCVDLSLPSAAFAATKAGSPLRRILAEEVVCQWSVERTMDADELDDLGKIGGFTVAFAEAMDLLGDEREEMFERLPTKGRRGNKRWMEYMVKKEGKELWRWVDCGDRFDGYFAM